jgi:RNA polymerase sigma-70 factor, ECF subfamily
MSRATELPDEDLLRRMMAGDEDSFVSLYRRRQGGIYRFALQMSGNPIIAEDVTQETFMALIRDPGRFDPTRGTVSAFLYGIARNYLLRRLQVERAFVPLPEETQENDVPVGANPQSGAFENSVEKLTRAETILRVRDAVLSLPANYREVVVLCELQEMSYEDAAASLECAIGTVRSRLHRARALLLSKLREKPEAAHKNVSLVQKRLSPGNEPVRKAAVASKGRAMGWNL